MNNLPVFLIICVFIQSIYAQSTTSFYCSSTSTLQSPLIVKISDSNSVSQIITRYENEKEYRENTLCTWQIEAPNDNRIELFDFQVSLPFAPDYSSCNMYDYLQIDNLNEKNSIIQMCRGNNVKYVLSTGNKLVVKFQSNNINNAKGIQFSIRIWDPKQSCPKTWFKTNNGKCLTIYEPNVKLSIEDSQTHCNYAQANLASFDTQEQITEFLLDSYARNQIKSDLHWIGLTDIENPGQLVWLDDNRAFDFKNVVIKKETENGDKNCMALEIPRNVDQKSPSFVFSRISCTQKTIKWPFICKMNQTSATKLATIPSEPSLKDNKENVLAIFLKIGFPILAILIAICLILIVLFAVKLEDRCSKNQLCMARLSTYSIVAILSILFIILFAIGIFTRRMVVMIIGIPVLILILSTIVLIICIHCRRDKSDGAATKGERTTATASELQELNRNQSLPSYNEAINA